jgi:hypothetical protein
MSTCQNAMTDADGEQRVHAMGHAAQFRYRSR